MLMLCKVLLLLFAMMLSEVLFMLWEMLIFLMLLRVGNGDVV